MQNILFMCHCKHGNSQFSDEIVHTPVVMINHTGDGTVEILKDPESLFNMFYLDVACNNVVDDTQFIGWDDFRNRNTVKYDKVYLLACPLYKVFHLDQNQQMNQYTYAMWASIMDDLLYNALKPNGQIIFHLPLYFDPDTDMTYAWKSNKRL